MKKLILGAAVAALFASPLAIAPAAAAPQQRTVTRVHTGPGGRTVVTKRVTRPARPAYRRWARGQRFDSRYAQNYQVVNNWQSYRGRHLYAPPRGYHWVRSGNDAVLVALAGGLIGAVVGGAFN
jgi:Ni/Co efflux regulator RcnB